MVTIRPSAEMKNPDPVSLSGTASKYDESSVTWVSMCTTALLLASNMLMF